MIQKDTQLRVDLIRLTQLNLSHSLVFAPGDTIKKVIETMQQHASGGVLILENSNLRGIFTERDVVTRVLLKKVSWQEPISKVMTANPKTLSIVDHLESAIRLMVGQGIRHIPLLDRGKYPSKIVSIRDVIDFLAEEFPVEILNLPPTTERFPKRVDGG